MLKTFRKNLIVFLKKIQKSIYKLFQYIKKLFGSDVPKNTEINIEHSNQNKSSAPEIPNVEQNIEIERENNSPNANTETRNNIYNIRANRSNPTNIVTACGNSNTITHEKVSYLEKISRKRKHSNIRYILLNRLGFSNTEKIFSTNDIVFDRMKGDVELLKIVLKNSSNADDIINIYFHGTTVFEVIKSILETSNIKPSDKNRLKQCLGIVSALYERKSIKSNDIIFDDEFIQNAVLTYFKHTVEPIIQDKFQQKCNLDYLLKGILNYKESEKSPLPSLQILCIENIIQNTSVQQIVS